MKNYPFLTKLLLNQINSGRLLVSLVQVKFLINDNLVVSDIADALGLKNAQEIILKSIPMLFMRP